MAPVRYTSSPSRTAYAAIGRSHPAPNSARNARSASTERRATASSTAASSSRAPSSSVRHSTAMAPWATWGNRTDGSRRSATSGRIPSRSRAAAAMTMASNPAAFSRRVPMFPLNPTNTTSGRRWARCARRRIEPVATVAPSGRSAQRHPTRTSRASARSGMQARTSPSGVRAGRSLAEWTATSARPSSTAVWTSFTNTPWPPICSSGVVRSRSPVVSTTTTSTSTSGRTVARSPIRWSVCHRARALPRVAARIRTAVAPA